MEWTARIRNLFRGISKREQFDRSMDEEVRFHIESHAARLESEGVEKEEALRRARMEFGPLEAHKEDCRGSFGLRHWDELCGNVRYALRALRKSPGFTAVAILTLALGIGANTAIFTLIDAMLLRMVPVHDAGSLMQLRMGKETVFTNPIWEEVRARQDAFSGLAAWGNARFNLSKGGAVQMAEGLWVSGDYFSTLQVAPALGRLITPQDDRRGCAPIAVLSYSFWQQHYAASPSVLGSTISLNARPYEVVGVAARGFYGLEIGSKFDVAAPICATAYEDGARPRLDRRSMWWLVVVGRKKPGLTPEQVNARLATISSGVFAASVADDWGAEGKNKFLKQQLTATPAGTGISYLRADFEQPLKVLMAVVGIVLLIACANIASLMLARAAAQEREFAVRLALGASRMRLVRQLLVHALMLSLAGGAAGVLVARWATTIVLHYFSTHQQQVFLDVSPDWRILAFTTLVAVATGVTLAVLPAFRFSRVPLTAAMRGAGSTLGERHHPQRRWIVAGQIALSMVLLVTAGLFLRSFVKLSTLDPGFDSRNVLLVTAELKNTRFKPEQQLAVFNDLEARLAAIPGVNSAGRAHITPLSNMTWNDQVEADVPNAASGHDALAVMNFVSPGYLPTLRMHLLRGRNFTADDTKTSMPVAIVNEACARKIFRGTDPLGHVFRVDKPNGEPGPPIQVVGVAANAKYVSLREEDPATVFFPISQIPEAEFSDTFVLRTGLPPNSLLPAVEAAAGGISREIPLRFATLSEQVGDSIVEDRLLAMLSAFFGGIALLLAMIGLYGTVSYRVTLRRAEFGIRMALGARAGSIVRLVIAEVAFIVAVGVAAGVSISLVATAAVRTLLFGLQPRDALTIASSAAVLAGVALAAAYAPARRAARVDPMIALRCE